MVSRPRSTSIHEQRWCPITNRQVKGGGQGRPGRGPPCCLFTCCSWCAGKVFKALRSEQALALHDERGQKLRVISVVGRSLLSLHVNCHGRHQRGPVLLIGAEAWEGKAR